MMKFFAPVALSGIVLVILWKILEILMAPIVAWILGVLAVGLKIGLAVVLATAAGFFVRQVMRARADGRDGTGG